VVFTTLKAIAKLLWNFIFVECNDDLIDS
jgi:hypothetical protein